jgi:hypothetical protein
MPYDSRDTLNDLFATGLIDLQRGALFDAVPQVHAAAVWPRVEGMLLGLAIGDALGNTSESLRPGERRTYHGEVRDYLPNPYADGRSVGLPSDDIQARAWRIPDSVSIGDRIPLSAGIDITALGNAIHACIATVFTDPSVPFEEARAARILNGFGLVGAIEQ